MEVQPALVDEHYYRPAEWFLKNADRYDAYDRNGPRIFAGEYASQSVAVTSPENKNNWKVALAEAAYMTGMERNADLVTMTSYAPLFAHVEAWQWTPDMIWFDNLRAVGTVNYYIQKMYANHPGTDVVSVTSGKEKVLGQQGIYASTTIDGATNELILKVANVNAVATTVSVSLKGKTANGEAKWYYMASADEAMMNSLDEPKKLAPLEKTVVYSGKKLTFELDAKSFNVIRIPIR